MVDLPVDCSNGRRLVRAIEAEARRPADSRHHACWPDDVRREGSRDILPADRATSPPEGAPNVLIVLIDDVGFGAASAFGGPISTPNAERLRVERAEVQPLPHERALLADARGDAQWPESPYGRDGRDHRDRDVGSRLQLAPPEHVCIAGRDAEAERLLDGAVRQVPRGAGVADEPDGPVRQLADGQRLRVLLRLHRRRGAPVLPGDLRGHHPGRAREDARRGLSLYGRQDRQGDQVGPPAEGAHAGQAVLRVFRARRDPRTPSRHPRVGRQVQGRVRRRLGCVARADLRQAEGARRDSRRRRADRTSRRDSRLGRDAGRAEARPSPSDGDLCRLPRVHRSPRGPAARRPRRPRRARTLSSTTSSATTAPRPRAR